MPPEEEEEEEAGITNWPTENAPTALNRHASHTPMRYAEYG
jgi:hypothetical protein